MRDFNQGRFQQQVKFLRRQFLQDGDLPFCNVLSEQVSGKRWQQSRSAGSTESIHRW